jgi:preprotein translocase subunit SecA
MLTRQIEKAQRKVESHNFDIRKQLLLFDDVANDQRKVVYQQRTEIMARNDLSDAVHGIREEAINNLVDQFMPKSASPTDWDVAGLADAVQKDFNARVDPAAWMASEPELEEPQLRARIVAAAHAAYDEKVARTGADVMRHIEKEMMLRMLDQHWREHLAAMDYLRQGIHLRGYAQKDYRFEYKREAFELFAAMLERVKFETVTVLAKIEIRTQEQIDREEEERRRRLMRALQAQHAEANSALALPVAASPPPPPLPAHRAGIEGTPPPARPSAPAASAAEAMSTFVRSERKIGRNEPCPCGSGKKYKHCHGVLSSVQ